MPYVYGFLRTRAGGQPDHELPEDPAHPDQGLPEGGGGVPGHLPAQPPGVWPPISASHPIQPAPPGTPPGTIWPPVNPDHPSQGLPGTPGKPSQGLPSMVYWVVAGIPGVGWRYVAVDPSLSAGTPPTGPAPKA